jgi:hypothetical protein
VNEEGTLSDSSPDFPEVSILRNMKMQTLIISVTPGALFLSQSFTMKTEAARARSMSTKNA